MTQFEIDRAVVAATGESITTVRRHGFTIEQPLEQAAAEHDDVRPNTIDWDDLDRQRSFAAA
jgi:hypothetical protein